MTKFKVPANTEFIEQTMENGMLITKFIPKVEEFKDLDCYIVDSNAFVIHKCGEKGSHYIAIRGTYIIENSIHAFYDCPYTKITRQEMQAELAKHGKVFDFENKVLKELRWRANKAEKFYFIDACVQVDSTNDYYNDLSERMFSIGNYFRTKQECQEFCDKVKKLLNSLQK